MNKLVSFAGAMSILSFLVILAAAPTQADASDVGHVVNTKSGKVSGTTVEDGSRESAHLQRHSLRGAAGGRMAMESATAG